MRMTFVGAHSCAPLLGAYFIQLKTAIITSLDATAAIALCDLEGAIVFLTMPLTALGRTDTTTVK
ncbi:hypothetical protein H6G17_09005 [Chroococcidiopsis sp. FACHB-1243]|uniref:hypothetical protein n=1 Tax=Chroococcidiopsis sp. [FACHB-1243] TaxID=2692781 RepID=UPI00178151BF|nr:hypothetical protein [Chroococcidiopsis sp. [FACHB-1243]]MBD2305655.1 hypothetical protein [Chroococcidiopsis sp. [FACHB-1243]]